jgi:hypothetical protein
MELASEEHKPAIGIRSLQQKPWAFVLVGQCIGVLKMDLNKPGISMYANEL